MSPFFSIIIATFNCEETLKKCLDSIFMQSEHSFELLVADGASSDKTLEILHDYKEKYGTRFHFLISEKDQGVYSAWNKALRHIKGEWVYFIGADDFLWSTSSLAQVNERLLMLDKNTTIAYGKIAVVSKDKEKVLYYEGEPWKKYKSRFLHEMVLPHQATFHRKCIFDDGKYFNEKFKICGDVELLMRQFINKKYPVFLGNDDLFAAMRVGGLSSEYKNVPLIISELKKVRVEHNLGFSYRIFLREFRFRFRALLSLFLSDKSMLQIVSFYRYLTGRNYEKK